MASNFTNKSVFIFSDSELLVNQLNRKYRVNNENLKDLYLQVRELEEFYENVIYTHVKREENIDADRLANEILDKVTKK